jgi:hypothetical protein
VRERERGVSYLLGYSTILLLLDLDLGDRVFIYILGVGRERERERERERRGGSTYIHTCSLTESCCRYL